jgi:hypothetical protein
MLLELVEDFDGIIDKLLIVLPRARVCKSFPGDQIADHIETVHLQAL